MKLRQLLQEMIFSVYKITNLVNGKVYIGKTKNVANRWKTHIAVARTKEKKAYQYLHKSINKYGYENFIIETIECNISEEQAFEREIYWISFYQSNNENFGMNLTLGGEGTSGYKWSEDSKDKKRGINNHNYGKPLSSEVKAKISIKLSGENNPFYGKQHSEEIINFLKNREVSNEIREIISKNCRGEKQWNAKFSNEDIIEIRRKWDSEEYTQAEIARQYGVKRNTINQIINRKRWAHI